MAARRPRLVLHGGTPKTATTSLQHAFDAQRDVLAARGVWYPDTGIDPIDRKHQALVKALRAGDTDAVVAYVGAAVRSAPSGTHTVVLSTEGLYNHWWDFGEASRDALRALARAHDAELWVCFREPLAFALANYTQYLRNPRDFEAAYGLDASFEEMLDNPRFVLRMNYAGFVRETQAVFGAQGVRAFRYGADIVERIALALGAGTLDVPRRHRTLRTAGVALMRVVNRYGLGPYDQARVSALVGEIDALIGARAEALVAGDGARRRVHELTAAGWESLQPMLAATDPQPA